MFGQLSERMVLAVDWDTRRLRLVHAGVRKGAVRIERMLSVDLPPGTDVSEPQALGAIIRQVLDQQKISTDRVILDVPRDQVLLTTLTLPPASLDEMPAMVELQIAKELPFPLAEAVVDFAVPPRPPAGGVADVLVGTVRREVLDYYAQTCAAAHLKMERIGLRPYANKVALDEMLGASRPETVVFVDVGPNLTEINVIRDGRLAFSRAASVAIPKYLSTGGAGEDEHDWAGGRATDGAEDLRPVRGRAEAGGELGRVLEGLLVEVVRSFEAYRAGSPGVRIDLIMVAGGTGPEARLAELVGRRFETTARLYHPTGLYGWSVEQGQAAQAFSAALGLAAGYAQEGRLQFDFLHPKKPVSESRRRLRRAPVVATAAMLFVAAGVVFYTIGVAPTKRALAETKRSIQDVKKKTRDLEECQDMVSAATAFEDEQVVWIDELQRVLDLLPGTQQMVLKRIDMYQKGARMSMGLESTSNEEALAAVQRLDDFRLGQAEEAYFDAANGTLTEKDKGQRYRASGSLEVIVLSKVKP